MIPAPFSTEQLAAFSGAIKNWLKASRGSQSEIARRLGVDQSTVHNWSHGKRLPSPLAIFALEQACGVPSGHFSKHLGFVPAHLAPKVGVPEAVGADERLSETRKAALIATYRGFLES